MNAMLFVVIPKVLRHGDAAQERERAQVVVREVDQPVRLLLLLRGNGFEGRSRFGIGNQEVAVDAEEQGEEGLARFEIAV